MSAVLLFVFSLFILLVFSEVVFGEFHPVWTLLKGTAAVQPTPGQTRGLGGSEKAEWYHEDSRCRGGVQINHQKVASPGRPHSLVSERMNCLFKDEVSPVSMPGRALGWQKGAFLSLELMGKN